MQYVTQESKSRCKYVIDCREACGDIDREVAVALQKRQREVAGLVSASGSDARGFCGTDTCTDRAAATVNLSIQVCGSNSRVVQRKLGMNGKDHIERSSNPEDCLGGFCDAISENDGVNRRSTLACWTPRSIGTGSAPGERNQAVWYDPLDRAGMKMWQTSINSHQR